MTTIPDGPRRLLLDTHAVAWHLLGHSGLSTGARSAIADAASVAVSAGSLYEVAFKVSRGQWPDMAPLVPGIEDRLAAEGMRLLPATGAVFLRAGLLDWPHRDPFDRIIGATAEAEGATLVSGDTAFDSYPGRLHRVW